jgi:hypothetical protein
MTTLFVATHENRKHVENPELESDMPPLVDSITGQIITEFLSELEQNKTLYMELIHRLLPEFKLIQYMSIDPVYTNEKVNEKDDPNYLGHLSMCLSDIDTKDIPRFDCVFVTSAYHDMFCPENIQVLNMIIKDDGYLITTHPSGHIELNNDYKLIEIISKKYYIFKKIDVSESNPDVDEPEETDSEPESDTEEVEPDVELLDQFPQLFQHNIDVNTIDVCVRHIYGVAVKLDGTIIIINGNCISSISLDGMCRIIAGATGVGSCGFSDGPRLQSRFDNPCGIAIMADQTIIVADTFNHRIRAIGLDGIVRTIAGTGDIGLIDGLGSRSKFNYPHGVAVMADQTIIITDTHNHRIRAIGLDQVVRTIAGTGHLGFLDGTAIESEFRFPYGITVMPNQTIIVADTYNQCIRAISATRAINNAIPNDILTVADYTVRTIAGSIRGLQDGHGIDAQFEYPVGVAIINDHTIIVADKDNHCIRAIDEHYDVSSIAGTNVHGNANGLGVLARFNIPIGIAVGPYGTIYVADSQNQRIRIISQKISTKKK